MLLLTKANTPLVTYTRGNDLSGTLQGAGGIGGLLARSEPSTLNPQLSTALYHSDGNGNITALVTTNGTLAAKYHYDPYGNILSMAGPLAEANLYRFSSKEWHVNSGLVYYLYRYYEPQLQRWINRDPIAEAGGHNLFAFVGNHAGMAIDSFGLNWVEVSSNCQGHDLSGFTYLAESEPPSPEDQRRGRPEGDKRRRNVPEPGFRVKADSVNYPGGAMKIGALGRAIIDCSSGVPVMLDGTTGIWGDGARWNFGEPTPPDSGWRWGWHWPDPNIPPYEHHPPEPVFPPLDPSRIPLIGQVDPALILQ
jgi:RHS repeat-associated protein